MTEHTDEQDEQRIEADNGTPVYSLFDLSIERESALEAAQVAVKAGRNIVLPTDTVYGIGADAFSAAAVQGLLNAKRRGRDMPPPVLIAEPAMLPALVDNVPRGAQRMIEEFWPGGLTLILMAQSALRMDLGETGGTIAVRVPDNDDARELLRSTGPLAVSSANVSGQQAATQISDAIEMLGDSVAVYLDGGATVGPMASTIVDFASTTVGRVVRQGVIGFDLLAGLAPGLQPFVAPQGSHADNDKG